MYYSVCMNNIFHKFFTYLVVNCHISGVFCSHKLLAAS